MIKKIKRALMTFSIVLLSVVVVITISTLIFINSSPQFGQPPKGEHLKNIQESPNYGDKSFKNLVETSTGEIWEALKKMPEMFSSKGKEPIRPLVTNFVKQRSVSSSNATYVTWYGHSAFLIELEGKRILIDPMFGNIASPLPFGSRRFKYKKPIPIEQFKNIDAVIISHDHYDHLDYTSIKKLKSEVSMFITPLGVGSHLQRWEVEASKIIELDWWEDYTLDAITYTATPARHFSGRGLTDRDATQWASWVINGQSTNLYFSGDSGYSTHFKQIADQLGPFDFAMIECGQYNTAWSQIHMLPEQSVQAGIDINATIVMPIHWGAFRLAPHSWTDPITRFTKAADSRELSYLLPTIGERFNIGEKHLNTRWWIDK